MCSICTDGAFEAVASVCAVWFFLDQQIYKADRKKKRFLPCTFTPSWLTGCLVGSSCTRALFVVWRAMHYGTVHIYSAHTHTHRNSAHFLDRKFRRRATTKDTALPCLRSEVKRVLFRRPWVYICVCARVSPTLAQTADICRPVARPELSFKICWDC